MKAFAFFALLSLMFACVQNEIIPVVNQAPPTTVVLPSSDKNEAIKGMFTNGVHTTSGTVKVLTDSLNTQKRYLSFENLMTDAGPDLYIYMAENTGAKNHVSITKLTQKGTFYVEIPAQVDLKTHPYVLIWCKQFSVLFGSARLN
jgi:hypothetical protein